MVGLFNSVTGSQIEAERLETERLEAERLEAERKKQEAEHEQEEAEYEQQETEREQEETERKKQEAEHEQEEAEYEQQETEREHEEAEYEQYETEYEQQTDLPTLIELYDYFNFVRTEYGKFKAHKGVDADGSVSKEVAMKALKLENSSFTRTELNSQYRRMVINYLLNIELEYKAFSLMNAAYDKLFDSAI